MEQQQALNFIAEKVKTVPALVLMKGTPDRPLCGFSARVCEILSMNGVAFDYINVLSDPALREAGKIFSEWPTYPQVYIKGEFVGGCDILTQMAQNGELKTLIAEKLSK